MAEIEISIDLDRIKKYLLVGFLLIVFGLELSVTINGPIAFGDEGFHVSTSRYVGTEVDFSASTPLFGSEINPERFTRAPFWNLMEASFYMLFGFNDMIIKVLMPFVSFLTGLIIYIFVKKLYSENAGIVAAAVAVTIPSFVTYSVLFYTTVPYVFFFSIAFLSLLTAMKFGGRKWWIISGLFSGIALFTNIAGLFMPILVTIMGILHVLKKPSIRSLIEAGKTYGIVALIISLVVMPWAARNIGLFYVPGCDDINLIVQGACKDTSYFKEAETNAEFVGREASGGTSDSVLNIGIVNYLRFAYGFNSPNFLVNLIGFAFVPFSLIAGIVLIGKKRELHDIAVIVSLVIFAGLFYQFGGFLEGRSEDTARYFLSLTPIIGISAGVFWASVRKDGHKLNGLIVIAVITIIMLLSFLSVLEKTQVMGFVKNFSPTFFEACEWIKQNTAKDSILFSLHTYPTRYNCERASSWELPIPADKKDLILSNNITVMKDVIDRNGIDYIFVQKFAISSEPLERLYPISFLNTMEANNATFRKVYENGPPLHQCLQQGGCDGTIVYEILD